MYDFAVLQKHLVRDEDLRKKPYVDTVGKISIGIGRNLTDVGLRLSEIEFMFANDVKEAEATCRVLYPNFARMDDVRQLVVMNMAFNMGLGKLAGFITTNSHINAGRYIPASQTMLQSKWAKQVGERAKRLSEMMRTGRLPK